MLSKLKAFGKRIKEEIEVYQLVRKHKRTPFLAKIILWIAIGYLFSPIDLIPDFIPVLGSLDDFILVPALVILALRMIPKEVVEECRAKVQSEGKPITR
jgi:uncharacterized membrane protein YkvA (DUF1232 family)